MPAARHPQVCSLCGEEIPAGWMFSSDGKNVAHRFRSWCNQENLARLAEMAKRQEQQRVMASVYPRDLHR
jgi:hypothetical protein